jgi:hypothetical protein
MIPLTMEYLTNCFNRAKELNMNYVAVAIKLPNAEGKEIIINGKENFNEKLKYYQSAYDENLVHKHVSTISITGFTFGKTFDEIETDLVG